MNLSVGHAKEILVTFGRVVINMYEVSGSEVCGTGRYLKCLRKLKVDSFAFINISSAENYFLLTKTV